MDAISESGNSRKRALGMSYKFQRLRERIRKAVETGELSGKLPGERALARRFHVNAKTLSKALTDLAAEGLLDRSIGRGTYVKGAAPAPGAQNWRWLMLCQESDANSCTLEHLRAAGAEVQLAHSIDCMRPSFVNQFSAVIDFSGMAPETVIRDLIVRNLPVVVLNREPATYSVHSVLMDVPLAASRLCRDLLLAGHRRLGAIEPRGSHIVAPALQQTISRLTREASVDVAEPARAAELVESGVTGLICASAVAARETCSVLHAHNLAIPTRASVVGIGCQCDCGLSGYFVDCRKIADCVIDLLRVPQPRPISMWLSGAWLDRGTLSPNGTDLLVEPSKSLHVSGVMV